MVAVGATVALRRRTDKEEPGSSQAASLDNQQARRRPVPKSFLSKHYDFALLALPLVALFFVHKFARTPLHRAWKVLLLSLHCCECMLSCIGPRRAAESACFADHSSPTNARSAFTPTFSCQRPDFEARSAHAQATGLRNPVVISTESPDAQALFQHGLLQSWGFNQLEAGRSFAMAVQADSNCAMCLWGVAHARGPFLNRVRFPVLVSYLPSWPSKGSTLLFPQCPRPRQQRRSRVEPNAS